MSKNCFEAKMFQLACKYTGLDRLAAFFTLCSEALFNSFTPPDQTAQSEELVWEHVEYFLMHITVRHPWQLVHEADGQKC